MMTKEVTLLGQYINDLSFENPMSPNSQSPDVNQLLMT